MLSDRSEKNFARFAKMMKKTWEKVLAESYQPIPGHIYGIAFTPRSGSTWLADIIKKSRVLGIPNEWFNQAAAAYSINASGARNFAEYWAFLRHARKRNEIFGFEISYQDLRQLQVEGHGHFLKDVGSWVYLRRRDFVAQAVSIWRSKESGLFHIQEKGDEPESFPKKGELEYDAAKIVQNILLLMHFESGFSGFFKKRCLQPSEIWYEDLRDKSYEEIIDTLAGAVGIDIGENERAVETVSSSFRVVSNEDSQKMVRRFKEENPEFVKYWNESRGVTPVWKFVLKHPSYINPCIQRLIS